MPEAYTAVRGTHGGAFDSVMVMGPFVYGYRTEDKWVKALFYSNKFDGETSGKTS